MAAGEFSVNATRGVALVHLKGKYIVQEMDPVVFIVK